MATKPTKSQLILKLIRRPKGANIAALQKATGWQPHSIRAALTGLRKQGVNIDRACGADGKSVYRSARA